MLVERGPASKYRLPSGAERVLAKLALDPKALASRSLSMNGGGTASKYLLPGVPL